MDVYVTELDVDINDIKNDDRLLFLGAIYREIVSACLEEGVIDISFFGGMDENNWLEETYGRKQAQPTLFNREGPEIAYYEVLKVLLK